jgi:hypothetical protein
MTENPFLTTAEQMYETERLASENKRLKKVIDEYLKELQEKNKQIEGLKFQLKAAWFWITAGFIALGVINWYNFIEMIFH